MRDDSDPDITVAGLSMWIEGHQFPDSTEYWDANWVIVRVVCIGQRSRVELLDPCVHIPELKRWLEVCIALDAGTVDKAELPAMEPYFQVVIDRSGDFGRLVATVKLTPDNRSSFHEFVYPIDPSYVRSLIDSLRRVLARFPIRYAEGR